VLEGEDTEHGKAYWSQQAVCNFPPPILPFEAKLNSPSIFDPKVFALNIEPDLVANIEAIAALHHATVAEFLFACWQTLIVALHKTVRHYR
jgi:hypothetical protein